MFSSSSSHFSSPVESVHYGFGMRFGHAKEGADGAVELAVALFPVLEGRELA